MGVPSFVNKVNCNGYDCGLTEYEVSVPSINVC